MDAPGGFGDAYNKHMTIQLDKIENALLSLNSEFVKEGGKLTWKSETGQFESRGTFQNTYYQRMVNIVSSDATCTNLIQGLETLANVSNDIFQDLKKANTKCSKEDLIKLEQRMLGIKKILANSSKCLSTLEQNYRSAAKDEGSIEKIHAAGERIFAMVTASEAVLAGQLEEAGINVETIIPKLKTPENLNLNHSQTIEQYNAIIDSEIAANKIIANVSSYKNNLAVLDIFPEQGIVIPNRLVNDCIGDAILKKMTNKKTLRETSNKEEPFNNARPLNVPQSKQVWEAKAITQTLSEEQSGPVKITKKEIETKDNAAIPTSLRDIDHPEVNHLANFKVQIDRKDGHICITCGVIDTQKKADEFIAGLISSLKARAPQTPPIPLRIVLHQVNSSSGEKKLVSGQHEMSHYIEKQLRTLMTPDDLRKAGLRNFPNDTPIVVHINASLNLTSALPLSMEDSLSYTLNLDGLAAQSIWCLGDFAEAVNLVGSEVEGRELGKIIDNSIGIINSYVEISKIKKNIEELNKSLSKGDSELESVESQIEKINEFDSLTDEAAVNKLKALEEKREVLKSNAESRLSLTQNPQVRKFIKEKELELKSKQALLSKDLKEIAQSYHAFQSVLSKIEKPTADQIMAQNKSRVLGLLIAKQTQSIDGIKFSNFSRNQEIELSLILDMMLGITTEINCKSGLDRTGLARSMWDSLRTMKEQFSQEFIKQGITDPQEIEALACQRLIDLVLQHDDLSKELDHFQMELIPKFEGNIARNLTETSNKPGTIPIRKKLIDAIQVKYSNDRKRMDALVNALNYQDLIAANLLSVAQPITMESTGMAGLKYGHGKITPGNPHPLKRLPMFVSTEDGKIIQLYEVKYAGVGKESIFGGIGAEEHFFTPAGLELVERLSQQRGD